jgi:SAM-dependent methyltransferase
MIPNRLSRGYDLIAEGYLERYGRSLVRDQWLGKLITLLPTKSRVLDLGCGSGVPIARELARRGHDVVGMDGSARQVSFGSIECFSRHDTCRGCPLVTWRPYRHGYPHGTSAIFFLDAAVRHLQSLIMDPLCLVVVTLEVGRQGEEGLSVGNRQARPAFSR